MRRFVVVVLMFGGWEEEKEGKVTLGAGQDAAQLEQFPLFQLHQATGDRELSTQAETAS